MRRQAPSHGSGFQAGWKQRVVAAGRGRAASLLGLAAVVVLLLAGCGEASPYSQITPRSDKADDIQWLYQIVFWGAAVVFVGVQAFIIYTVLRWRRRNEDRPEQIHGNRRLELAWTIIPAVVLLVIFIPATQVLFRHAAAEDEANFVIDVYGKQWWWEFHYPNQGRQEGEPLITANEVRIPQGADVVFNLRSNNVYHAFYAPQLSGKVDVVPGHNNRLQFDASQVGEYFGECTEFCGTAHAWMRFKVIVEPQEEFNAWVQAWRQPPPVDGNAETADVNDAPASFGTCLACHNITGTNAVAAQSGMGANVMSITAAPNLTLFGCRDHLAGGLLENNRDNIITWLKNTDDVKTGTYMPNYYKSVEDGGQGALNDAQVEELADYLLSLQPEGGCPPDQPIGGTDGVELSTGSDDQ